MSGLIAILGAFARVVERDLGSFRSIKLNNFFLFVALMVWGALNSGLEPKSAEPFLLLLGMLVLFPLSADPLDRAPASRLALWPLSASQRFGLRVGSLGFAPVIWVAAMALLFLNAHRPALGFLLLLVATAVQGLGSLGRRVSLRAPQWNVLRLVPRVAGPLGELIRNNLRQMLSVLDVYIAIALSCGGAAWRVFSRAPDPQAFPILAILVALSMSTYAQCMFGLDRASSAMVRYRVFPLPGWQILLAKDVAYLGVLAVLVLPLDAGAGLAFGLTAVAIGHHPSVLLSIPLRRWRFAGGRILPGVIQILAAMVVALGERRWGFVVLLPACGLFALSVWVYGRQWDRG